MLPALPIISGAKPLCNACQLLLAQPAITLFLTHTIALLLAIILAMFALLLITGVPLTLHAWLILIPLATTPFSILQVAHCLVLSLVKLAQLITIGASLN